MIHPTRRDAPNHRKTASRAIALAGSLWLAHSATAQVELRGGAWVDDAVVEVGPAGVRVAAADSSTRLLGWHEVKRVSGENEARAAAFRSLSDDVWRAWMRLQRGDYDLAEPIFERLWRDALAAPSGQDAPPTIALEGPTGMVIAEGVARIRLWRGALPSAVEPWATSVALRRDIAGDAAASISVLDPQLPPVFVHSLAVERLATSEPNAVVRDDAVAARSSICTGGRAANLLARRPRSRDRFRRRVAPDVSFVPELARRAGRITAAPASRRRAAGGRPRRRRIVARGVGSIRHGRRGAPRRRRTRSTPRRRPDPPRAVEVLGHPATPRGTRARSRGDRVPASRRRDPRRHAPRGTREVFALASRDPWMDRASRAGAVTPVRLITCVARWSPAPRLAQTPADRAVERYLETHGLRSAAHRAPRRAALHGGGRNAALAERLTRLVAEELEAAPTPARRAELERRARALLDVIPEGDSIDLRLSLHRAAYTSAEQIAERWRLRLATSEEAEEARRVLATLGPELARLGAIAHRRVDNLERLEQSAREGADEEAIAQQLADARRQRSMAMYLSGWCLAYTAELTGQRGPALEAMPRFGWLLNAEMGKAPVLDRVPEQTLRFEHVARAALGVATCVGIAGDPSLALGWIEAVERTNAENADVLLFASRRRIITLARAGRWTELYEHIRETRGVPATAPESSPTRPLDPVTARLLAVLAFELPPGPQPAPQQALRRVAFADLVGAGQRRRSSTSRSATARKRLGEQGFVTDYVRASGSRARGAPAGGLARRAHA